MPSLLGPAVIGAVLAVLAFWGYTIHQKYTFSLRWPVIFKLQFPVVMAHRMNTEAAAAAQADQNGKALSAWQEYACEKFGPDCRIALAIQRAENPKGNCEIYHYNNNGTLDWGYFQVNTVHLTRPGLNLRDLLDCKANIDFAYELFVERHGFTPWSTYNSGAYLKFMRR